MAWVPEHAAVLLRVPPGIAPGYVRRGGRMCWEGDRPGPDWHGHGWLPRTLHVFDGVAFVVVVVWRHRWLLVGTTRTTISRCPDEVPRLWFGALVVVLKVWAWIAGPCGVHTVAEVHEALEERPSTRTTQRWLHRALPRAKVIEQALRDAILVEESELWPAEKMFPGGLPPPVGLRRRRWADPEGVERLYRGLLWLVGGAVRLGRSLPILLARARGRWPDPTNQALI